jgi:hypothetical protein
MAEPLPLPRTQPEAAGRRQGPVGWPVGTTYSNSSSMTRIARGSERMNVIWEISRTAA